MAYSDYRYLTETTEYLTARIDALQKRVENLEAYLEVKKGLESEGNSLIYDEY